MNVFYDEKGAVGRRYRRQDEIGTPFCITVDGQTLTDGTVTIRDRDTLQAVAGKEGRLSWTSCDSGCGGKDGGIAFSRQIVDNGTSGQDSADSRRRQIMRRLFVMASLVGLAIGVVDLAAAENNSPDSDPGLRIIITISSRGRTFRRRLRRGRRGPSLHRRLTPSHPIPPSTTAPTRPTRTPISKPAGSSNGSASSSSTSSSAAQSSGSSSASSAASNPNYGTRRPAIITATVRWGSVCTATAERTRRTLTLLTRPITRPTRTRRTGIRRTRHRRTDPTLPMQRRSSIPSGSFMVRGPSCR